MQKSKTIQDLSRYIKNELSDIYPEREINSLTEIVLKHVVNLKKSDLLLNRDQIINEQHVKEIEDITKQLKNYKPVQQVLGETEFYNLALRVYPYTLIPRQETEELVDWIVKEAPSGEQEILDIGTGSGCIAIALARNLRYAKVSALDYRQEIIDVARENAALNGVAIRFILADILQEGLPLGKYDLIVSNPPYVRETEKKSMHHNILDHEPSDALFVNDEDPLIFYRRMIMLAPDHLRKNGKIYFEINEHMGQEMVRLLEENGFHHIQMKKDLNNKDRMIKAMKP